MNQDRKGSSPNANQSINHLIDGHLTAVHNGEAKFSFPFTSDL